MVHAQRTTLSLLLALAVLAGCSRTDDASSTTAMQPPASSADVLEAPPDQPAPSTLDEAPQATTAVAWPLGIDAPFQTFVRGSDVTVNKLEQQRSRSVAEYQGLGFEDAVSAINAAMTMAGFSPRAPLDQPNGNTILRFDKPGYGTVNFTVMPRVIGKPRQLSSQGMLILDTPIDAALSN